MKLPCYYVLIIFSSQHALETHRLIYKNSNLFFLHICRQLPVFPSVYHHHRVLYKAES